MLFFCHACILKTGTRLKTAKDNTYAVCGIDDDNDKYHNDDDDDNMDKRNT